jgi:hypothetical protein
LYSFFDQLVELGIGNGLWILRLFGREVVPDELLKILIVRIYVLRVEFKHSDYTFAHPIEV